jgi:carbonic anhydrase/acetyltransferase-like protein (isoleucine patch superfamily)
MRVTHVGNAPRIHASAYVAPNAVVCGAVNVGKDSRIMFGAQVIAEGGSITIGSECVVMENVVLRSSEHHSLRIGNNCLIGPNSHVVGCTLEDEVFLATGTSIFHAAFLGKGCEVRINGVVHLKTHLKEGEVVPIGWVAVGNPAVILPAEQHDKIWELQRPLNFNLTVYGLDRSEASMVNITRRVLASLAKHKSDSVEPDH